MSTSKPSKELSEISFDFDPSDENSNVTYYDDLYFDSDISEYNTEGEGESNIEKGSTTNFTVGKKENLENKRKNQKKKLSPDELLYDPHMDEDDERWLENKITQYNNPSTKAEKNKNSNNSPDIISGTDAIISCPMCFTNLSYHTQRHEIYVHQYRAIFVENCNVIQSEQLIYQDRPLCAICGTKVAVIDQEEVYHFFNIIES
ncbi:5001_t:CDS:2 [Diversispora eburnea]|uniref:5001_t:CDS:1 n=1 Tax=Diversispora eburnea TaxID=1213867 RepID=A0A9N9BEG8_9GLOM|nr:5001_t:CDS:2 [Diversispora eburnea]